MLRKFESIIPTFLKKLDRQLLLNRPGLWATKIHYAVFFGAIGYALMTFIGFTSGVDLTSVPNYETGFALAIIPAAIFFLIWAFRISLFQVEKGHGEKLGGSDLRDQIVYGLVIMMLAAAPILYGKLVQNKVKNAVSQSQLAKDINTLNLGESLFVTDSYEFENLYGYNGNICCNVKYIGYNRYTYYSNSNPDVWSEHYTESKLKNIHGNQNKANLLDEYIHTFNKYSKEKIPFTGEQILAFYKNKEWKYEQTEFNQAKYKVVDNIWAVQRAYSNRGLFTDRDFVPIYLLVLTTLFMALQAFLKTNWKIFGGAIIAGVATAIALGITGATLSSVFYMNDDMLFMMIAGCFGFYMFQAFRRKHTQRAKIWKTISLILVTVVTPFMPLILANGIDGHVSSSEGRTLIYWGIALSILCWNLLYNQRFTKLAAQPKEN